MFEEYPDKEKEAGDRPLDALLLTTQTIMDIHKNVLQGDSRAGTLRKYEAFPNDTQKHYTAPDLLEQTLQEAVDMLNDSLTAIQNKKPNPNVYFEKILYPVCAFIHRFLHIHPFSDGNGRVARLLLGAMFHKEHPVLFLIPTLEDKDRNIFLDALREADMGNTSPFVELIVRSSLQTWEAVRDEVVREFGEWNSDEDNYVLM